MPETFNLGSYRPTVLQLGEFSKNSEIVSFDELSMFTSVKIMRDGSFFCCTNLKRIGLINIDTLTRTSGNSIFGECIYLEEVFLPNIITCAGWAFAGCTSLNNVYLGHKCTAIYWRSFQYCPCSFFVCMASTPPTMSDSTLSSSAVIYVPEDSVLSYKEATGWISHSQYIKSLSELQTDNPSFYDTIKQFVMVKE